MPWAAVRGMRDQALVEQKIADAFNRHRIACTIDGQTLVFAENSSLQRFRRRPRKTGCITSPKRNDLVVVVQREALVRHNNLQETLSASFSTQGEPFNFEAVHELARRGLLRR